MYYYLVKIISHNILEDLTYEFPLLLNIGDLVVVKLKNKQALAIVIEMTEYTDKFIINSILSIFVTSSLYKQFITKIAQYYHLPEKTIYKKIIGQSLYLKKNDLQKNREQSIHKTEEIILNKEQTEIIKKITNQTSVKKIPFVLHGITGSGKTFIYIELISHYLKMNQSIICLFPNTHLAITITEEFKKYLPDAPLYTYHCHTTKNERNKIWQRIREKKNIVVCGVQLPIFLPIEDIGIYIIDEEHDTGYQEMRFPYINIKEAALIRARIENTQIILSSATPSIQTMYQVFEKQYEYGQLTERYHRITLPKITQVQIENKQTLISPLLKEKIDHALDEKEQVLLFFNKKGFFSYATCYDCKDIFYCTSCSVLLTIYENNIAKCHRCNFKMMIPEYCQKCKTVKTKIEKIGFGLNRLYKTIETLFPQAKIKQIDGDLLKQKSEYHYLIEEINDKKYDIIIGTQIITKGYNFNGVSLVGIINADMLLHLPYYRNTEDLIQQIIQVSGRAGRQKADSEVIIQTFINNELSPYFEEKNYIDYIQYELKYRKLLSLPPHTKQGIFCIKGFNEKKIKKIIENIHEQLKQKYQNFIDNKELFLSPVNPSLYKKIKKNYYYQFIIQSEKYIFLHSIAEDILQIYSSKEYFLRYIPNPILSFYE